MSFTNYGFRDRSHNKRLKKTKTIEGKQQNKIYGDKREEVFEPSLQGKLEITASGNRFIIGLVQG